MCGICGFYTSNESKSENDLIRMTDSISHRGPDNAGYFFKNNIGLGHRRLSILDVSDFSNQPFYSSCGNYVIVFNGEIYNYKELYKKLNITPKTTGDTEVIIELFIQYGPSFVSMLNGMFAFVILDINKSSFYIFRDRLGVKPLFYGIKQNTFVFASEIKAILAYDKHAYSEIQENSISDFLHLGYVSEPDTAYRHIKKFPSGHYAFVDQSFQISFQKYWSVTDKLLPEAIQNEQEAKKGLKSLLISSIEYRMISDVPIGTFLSGGIDSSLVTAIAQSLSPSPVNTFSIGFKESAYNESEYAKKVANYFKTNHYEFIVSEQDALDNLMNVMDSFDEPFIDTSALPTYMVSKLASQHVKVVLSGDGGDELFLGYGSYQWAKRLNKIHFKVLQKIFYIVASHQPVKHIKAKAEMFNLSQVTNIESHIFSQEQFLFTIKEIKKHFNSISSGKQYNHIINHAVRKFNASEQQAFFDLATYLKDDLLVKVDRMTMLNSIEGREPLLDYRLVEFAVNLHPDLKIKNGCSKYLLKEVLYDYIPREYFDRPKWGFSIPLQKWLTKKLQFLIKEYLSETTIAQIGIVEPKYVLRLIDRFEKGEYFLYHKIWQLIIVHRFLMQK